MGEEDATRLGLYIPSQQQQGDHPRAGFDRLWKQIELAIEVGFSSIMVGEHHASPGTDCFPSFPLLSRISAQTDDLQLGTSVALAALHHPLHLASSAAFLDVSTRGHFVLGVGAGFRAEEFDALGIGFDTRVDRMTEAISLIRRLWTGETVTFDGTHFSVSGAVSDLRPFQTDGPPIWLAATTDAGVRRAADIADAWIIDPISDNDTLTRRQRIYRAELSHLGKDQPKDVPRVVDVFVAATKERAHDLAGPAILAKRLASARARGVSTTPSEAMSSAILGSPRDVVAGIRGQVERFGVTQFSLRLSFPGISDKRVDDCIRLLGSEVLPAVAGW